MSDVNNLPATTDRANVDNKMAGISGNRDVFYSSFDRTTPEGKVAAFNAMTAAEPVMDHLNKPINMTHFAAQIVEFADENGEIQEGMRVIIIDDKGKAYAGLSDGLLRSIQNIISIFGDPSGWDAPLPIVISEERGKRGFRFFTVRLADPATK